MSGKEVEKRKSAEVAIPDDMLAEMEAASAGIKNKLDLGQDVRLPQLRLVQATTDSDSVGGAAAGTIHDTFTGDSAQSIQVVPLQMFKSRAYFGTGNIGDPPVCTSPDAITGYGQPGGDCSRCPHADWRNGGRCQLRYNYLVMAVGEGTDPENELPRGVMMHGTSAKIATRLNTMLLGSKFVWSNVLELSSTTEKNDRGQYKVWAVKRSRETTTEEQVLAFQWFKTMDAARSVEIADDTTTPKGDAPKNEDDIPF
jgi:hypothetical protein